MLLLQSVAAAVLWADMRCGMVQLNPGFSPSRWNRNLPDIDVRTVRHIDI